MTADKNQGAVWVEQHAKRKSGESSWKPPEDKAGARPDAIASAAGNSLDASNDSSEQNKKSVLPYGDSEREDFPVSALPETIQSAVIDKSNELPTDGKLEVNRVGEADRPVTEPIQNSADAHTVADDQLVQREQLPEHDVGQSDPGVLAYVPEGDFPVKALPEIIWTAVVEACANYKVPDSLAAQSALSVVSLACQDLILVRRPGLAASVCSLYMLAVAESAARKSEVDKAFAAELKAYDLRMREDHGADVVDYDEWLKDWQDKESALRNARKILLRKKATSGKLKNRQEEEGAAGSTRAVSTVTRPASEQANDPEQRDDDLDQALADIESELNEHRRDPREKPRLKRLLYEKIGVGLLERHLCDDWPAAGLFSNEAGGIFSNRTTDDMSRLDSLWDGQPVDLEASDRKRGYYVADPRLTLSLMVQPVIFEKFLRQKGHLAVGIGFLPRVLISRPESLAGTRLLSHTDRKSTGFLKKFNDRVKLLLESSQSDFGKRCERKTLIFSDAAEMMWRNDYNEKEKGMAAGGKWASIREFAGRYSEHVARMAALFHFFGNPGDGLEIPHETVRNAITVCEWYLEQHRRIFDSEVSLENDAREIFRSFMIKLASDNRGKSLDDPSIVLDWKISRWRDNCQKAAFRGPENERRFEAAVAFLVECRLVEVEKKFVGGSTRDTKFARLVLSSTHWQAKKIQYKLGDGSIFEGWDVWIKNNP